MGRDRVPPVPAPAGHIGARVKCGDDPRLLTGRGRYVDDLTLPCMAHVAFVRSTHAHARVTRVGLDAARRAPGVVGVLTGDGAARLCKPYRGVLLHEMRRRNLVRPEDLPYTSATGNVYDSGSYHAALARLLEVAAYDRLRREQAAARGDGRHLGIGLACFIELTGPGAQFYGVGGAPISGQEGTTVRLEPGGAVTALVAVTNQGQGTHTALAQIIADELDVPLDRVAVHSGDTAVVPYGGGTWASRGMPIGGSATLLAARARREDPDDRRDAPGSGRRRHRARPRVLGGPRESRAGSELRRPGAHRALPVERAPRRR